MTELEHIRLQIENEFQQFQQLLDATLASDNPFLHEVLRYVAAKKGKQLRPIIVLLSAKACGDINPKTIQTAVALELLHTASLLHDDVVDTSCMRRGRASINAEWDNKVAVLAGDFILSQALGMASKTRTYPIVDAIAELGTSLSSGELLQLYNARNQTTNQNDYFRVIEQKTARLFAICGETGACSVHASAAQIGGLRTFGHLLGLCFQIKDDVLDYTDSLDLGKPTLSDVRDGKITLPLIKAMERASEDERRQIRTLLDRGQLSEADLQAIRTFVLNFGGITQANEVMLAQKKQAQDALAPLIDSDAKRALLSVLDYSVSRTN